MKIAFKKFVVSQFYFPSSLLHIVDKYALIILPVFVELLKIMIVEWSAERERIIVKYLTQSIELIFKPIAFVS